MMLCYLVLALLAVMSTASADQHSAEVAHQFAFGDTIAAYHPWPPPPHAVVRPDTVKLGASEGARSGFIIIENRSRGSDSLRVLDVRVPIGCAFDVSVPALPMEFAPGDVDSLRVSFSPRCELPGKSDILFERFLHAHVSIRIEGMSMSEEIWVPVQASTTLLQDGPKVSLTDVPRVLQRGSVVYPESAMWAAAEGVVVVSVQVDSTGTVRGSHVVYSDTIRGLVDAACKAALGWRFAPARIGGQAVECEVLVPYVFRVGQPFRERHPGFPYR